MENDELLLGSLAGKPEEQKKLGKVVVKKSNNATYSKMPVKDLVNVIFNSELAGVFYPKDQIYINNFILDNRKKDTYEKQDLIDLTRMLIKTSI
jgi:pyrrolidone-carboxylate peptidase